MHLPSPIHQGFPLHSLTASYTCLWLLSPCLSLHELSSSSIDRKFTDVIVPWCTFCLVCIAVYPFFVCLCARFDLLVLFSLWLLRCLDLTRPSCSVICLLSSILLYVSTLIHVDLILLFSLRTASSQYPHNIPSLFVPSLVRCCHPYCWPMIQISLGSQYGTSSLTFWFYELCYVVQFPS